MKNYNFFLFLYIIKHQEEIELNFKKYTQSHLVDNFRTELRGVSSSADTPLPPPQLY
jgi:hypothetical protein